MTVIVLRRKKKLRKAAALTAAQARAEAAAAAAQAAAEEGKAGCEPGTPTAAGADGAEGKGDGKAEFDDSCHGRAQAGPAVATPRSAS